MIAIAVFLIGLVAVASLFPVSLTLQRYALNDVSTHAVASTAPAMIRSRGVTVQQLEGWVAGVPTVQRIDNTLVEQLWSLGDRTYPGTTPQNRRTVYWYPLFQRKAPPPTSATNWVAYVLIFQREHNDPEGWMGDPVQSINVNANYEGDGEIRIRLPGAGSVRTGEVFLDSSGGARRAVFAPGSDTDMIVAGDADTANRINEIWIGRRSATGQPTLRRIVPVADFAR